MRNLKVLTGLIAAGIILFGAALAMAQDWPQWRGINRDGKVAGFAAPAEWPKDLTEKWKTTVGSGDDATPALVGDKLYVFGRAGGDEVTICLNAADGKEVWRDKFAVATIGGPAAKLHAGPRSSPAVADGKVVTIGVTGVLTCLNAADGKVLWRKEDVKAVPQFFTSSSPMIADGLAIAHLGGKGRGALTAFDLATGAEKWKVDGQPASYSSPVLMTVGGTKTVVSLSEKGLIGVALADGKLLWEFPFAPSGMRSYNACTPIVDGATVYISGAGRGTKSLSIAKEGDKFAVTEQWSNVDAAVQYDTPVLQDGFLYGFTADGSLFCVSAKDGKTAWAKKVPGAAGGFCEIVGAGPVLFALPNNSELIAFKASDKGYEELAKYKVGEAATYAFPIIAGKNIYVADQSSVILWTLP